jgi:hypothetical protein
MGGVYPKSRRSEVPRSRGPEVPRSRGPGVPQSRGYLSASAGATGGGIVRNERFEALAQAADRGTADAFVHEKRGTLCGRVVTAADSVVQASPRLFQRCVGVVEKLTHLRGTPTRPAFCNVAFHAQGRVIDLTTPLVVTQGLRIRAHKCVDPFLQRHRPLKRDQILNSFDTHGRSACRHDARPDARPIGAVWQKLPFERQILRTSELRNFGTSGLRNSGTPGPRDLGMRYHFERWFEVRTAVRFRNVTRSGT